MNPSGKFFSFQLFIQYISAPEFVWFFFRVFYFFIDISVLFTCHFLDAVHIFSFSSIFKKGVLKSLSSRYAIRSLWGTFSVDFFFL